MQPNTHPPTFVSHLLLVPWDPFGLDGAQSEVGQHVVQYLRQKNLQTAKNTSKHRSLFSHINMSLKTVSVSICLHPVCFYCMLMSVQDPKTHFFQLKQANNEKNWFDTSLSVCGLENWTRFYLRFRMRQLVLLKWYLHWFSKHAKLKVSVLQTSPAAGLCGVRRLTPGLTDNSTE